MNINLFSTPTTSLTANYSLSSIINYSLINFTQQNKTVEKQSRGQESNVSLYYMSFVSQKNKLRGRIRRHSLQHLSRKHFQLST